MPRSSRRSTACANVACDRAKARWCTQPGSVGVRSGAPARSSLVKTVISRPSPGSKYRWLSPGLSRLGCSKTKGIPSTPSQKSMEVCRSAPTSVMWWTPWLWSLRILQGSQTDEFPVLAGSSPRMGLSTPPTLAFAIRGPLGREDLPGLYSRLCVLFTSKRPAVALIDVRGVDADAVTVDALARLQLAARRHGCQVRLRRASPELLELVAFMGLRDVLPDR